MSCPATLSLHLFRLDTLQMRQGTVWGLFHFLFNPVQFSVNIRLAREKKKTKEKATNSESHKHLFLVKIQHDGQFNKPFNKM